MVRRAPRLRKTDRLQRVPLRTVHSSSVAIIAPHGGKIESRTGEIARAIASDDFNLYVFEGILEDDNYTRLHLTSHKFDEPQCLDLISSCDNVVAIHGCVGSRPEILLGGRDEMLKVAIRHALAEAAIFVRTDDLEFQGRGICFPQWRAVAC
jgi:phage replication-related protein YjqB (UPF0714/DUF867 family)